MPCRDGGPEPETVPAWMLCEALVIIEKAEQLPECSKQLLDWWHAHQEKEEDKVRAEAASKLSARERLALGIDECGQNVKRTRFIRSRK